MHSSSDEQISVTPNRPSHGNFVDQIREYPRKATAQFPDCRCSSGHVICPNCRGTAVVTCPKCYTHRGGDCNYSDCKGTGKITHSTCHGTGICQSCGGRGHVTCSSCGGIGTDTITSKVEEVCSNCGGSGRTWYESKDSRTTSDEDSRSTTCYSCGGSGVVSRYVTMTVPCSTCRGSGRVTCDECYGSGRCPGCGGSGKVVCPECHGTGICQFCMGSGTKTCPTCHGSRNVICPICDGENQLFLYTSDIYEYKHTEDFDKSFPSEFEKVYDHYRYESQNCIFLSALTKKEILDKVGLFNNRVSKMLDEGIGIFNVLLKMTEDRQFKDAQIEVDNEMQKNLLKHVESLIDSAWGMTSKDNYYSEFKLSLSFDERALKGKDIHNIILYQEYLYQVFPSALTVFLLGNKKKVLYSVGKKENFALDVPSPNRSIPKIVLFSLSTIGSAASGLIWFGIINLPFDLLYSVIASISSTGLYILLLVKTTRTEREKLVILVGDSDVEKTTFFSILAHQISLTKIGVVYDEIYPKLSEYLLGKDLELGASLSYSVKMNNGTKIRFIDLSTTSYREPNASVKRLVGDSSGLIVFINVEKDVQSQFQRISNILSNQGNPKIAVISNKQLDLNLNISDPPKEWKFYTLDFEKLKEIFINSKDDKNLSDVTINIVESII